MKSDRCRGCVYGRDPNPVPSCSVRQDSTGEPFSDRVFPQRPARRQDAASSASTCGSSAPPGRTAGIRQRKFRFGLLDHGHRLLDTLIFFSPGRCRFGEASIPSAHPSGPSCGSAGRSPDWRLGVAFPAIGDGRPTGRDGRPGGWSVTLSSRAFNPRCSHL
jgi:hypothetical protein